MKYFNVCKSNCVKFTGCMGSHTYACVSDLGNDCINDSDGSGQITVDGQMLSAQNAKKVSANTYKDKSAGWTFFKGDVQTDGHVTSSPGRARTTAALPCAIGRAATWASPSATRKKKPQRGFRYSRATKGRSSMGSNSSTAVNSVTPTPAPGGTRRMAWAKVMTSAFFGGINVSGQ